MTTVEHIVVSTPADLAAAVRAQAEAAIDQLEIGEGKNRLIIAGRPRRGGCNGCTFCCTAAGINELQKPPMQPCRHLAGKGCGIYAERPETCRAFACAWLMGNFDERFRPDKIGAYVAFFCTIEHGFYAVVQLDRRRQHTKRVRQLIARLAAALPEVRVIRDDKDGLILRWGRDPQHFTMMPRPAGDFETAIYRLDP